VVFAGWRTDIPRILAAMDVFVMQSTFEGGPTTVLEAMAAQRAVVATCVGMVPEVINDGETGLITPVRDSHALAQAVGRLLEDGALRERMAQRAREHALGHFSIQQMVDRYLEVAAEALISRGIKLAA
jgi:glycosyltransferase involved in cell wall biosynthesis